MLGRGRTVGESIRINTVDGIVELSVCPVAGVQLKIGVNVSHPIKTKALVDHARAADKRFNDRAQAA